MPDKTSNETPKEIVLDYELSLEENASRYFDRAKKLKAKAEGAKEAIKKMEEKLEKLRRQSEKEIEKQEELKRLKERAKRKKRWFEKFRWFFSSEGFLVIGGRDATTNEIVIKKHTDSNDIVFHTDMAGSPFFVIKAGIRLEDGKITEKEPEPEAIGDATLEEAAQATASFSRAWKLGLGTLKVFHVKPEQVTKETNAGEFMPKGAFMIRGKTTYHQPMIELAAGILELKPEGDRLFMCGPPSAVKAHCSDTAVIRQGDMKPSDAAKKLKA
ncbi:DUF814 domain-containing protein, partial [Candidatus Woesearchaeota archaeon]